MANVFKNAYLDGTGSFSANHEVIVLSLRATNVDGTNSATVDVRVVDGSSGDSYIAKGMTVPAGASLELAGNSKLVLMATDKIQALASATSDIEFFASYLEIED